jgi:hypothetical protein
MKKACFLIAVAMLVLVGCTTMGGGPSVCDTIPEGDSQLCAISIANGVRLEDAGNALTLATAVAIGEGVFTKEQAIEIYTMWMDMLNNGITYTLFGSELKNMDEKYPGMSTILLSYFEEAFGIDELISPVDKTLIQTWLQERINQLTVQ